MHPQVRPGRSLGRRRIRVVLTAVIGLVFILWGWIFIGIFRQNADKGALAGSLETDPPLPKEPPETPEVDPEEAELAKELGFGEPETILEYYTSVDCNPDTALHKTVLLGGQPELKDEFKREAKSAKLLGNPQAHAEMFHGETFLYSVFPLDDCVRLFDYPRANTVRMYRQTPLLQKKQISDDSLLKLRSTLLPDVPKSDLRSKPAKYRVVFSCESSEYFGYQVWANRLAFEQSQKGYDATWTRLLTCQKPDDIASDPRFPTFTAQRSFYALRYSPINKPDVITKWYASPDRPTEDVIVVIDPDSWLLKPLWERFVERVSEGNALGQAAYYTGSRTAQKLWRELCEKNCDKDMDLVGVPYVVHREDLAKIAPLWKYYVLKIKYRLERGTHGSEEFAQRYQNLDVNWASEMYGYNMAAAHLGIKHEIVWDLQVRDVDGERTFDRCKNKVSLHMGRAWFPRGHADAKPYIHTEGKSFRGFGDQVWCKCNYTASTVKPWPVPEGTDFVSYHTLRLLHESEQVFGKIPENEEWRHKKELRHGYGWAHP